ncbi:MAG: thrombospondin type 3 repeat-containing protein [Chloroflexi bacterium]|nr:thrombospondin type 3 repeat-containing protein [Chloroflexota bacterium]
MRTKPARARRYVRVLVVGLVALAAALAGVLSRGTPAESFHGLVFVSDASVQEGNSGTLVAQFFVSVTDVCGFQHGNATVSVATANGTAIAGSDYFANSAGFTFFCGGPASQVFQVTIISDPLHEPNETFFVNVTSVSNASVADGQGVGTILNDDSLLSINDVSVSEGDAGTVDAVFTVTRNTPSPQTATVNFATADGTATAGSDYAGTAGTLVFGPGETSKTVTVTVDGDTLDEADETFFVNLSNATTATIVDGQGVGTILDDDPLPSLSINNVTVAEGNAGTTNAAFTVTLSAASGQVVTVNFATADGTATAGIDYVAASGTLTFNPGDTSKPVPVVVNGDTTPELTETFYVNLSGAINATIGDAQGVGTITTEELPDFVIPWSAFSSGGDPTSSSSPNYRLGSTIGQPAVGQSSSTNYRLGAGFLFGAPFDPDADGVDAISDNCPLVANPGQQNVVHPGTPAGDHCEDPEPDGVFDISDNCSDTVNPLQQNAVHPGTPAGDHCEDPEPDGVMDATDNCPNVANPLQENADGDKWGDACDNCPATATPWLVPAGDGDCDGWTDADEGLIGTNAGNRCGTEWPANMNNGGVSVNKVDIFDVNALAPPAFFSSPPSVNYSVRKDLSAGHAPTDPKIDIFDANKLAPPVFFAICTP